MIVTLNRIGNSITGSVNGEPFGIVYSEDKWLQLTELEGMIDSSVSTAERDNLVIQFKAAIQENFKELVETKTPYIYVNKATGKFFLKVGEGDSSRVSSQPLPSAFVDRMIESIEQGLSVLPLVKAWSRFLRNPNYTADKAVRFANYINYKYVNYEFAKQLESIQGVSRDVAIERATTYQTPITQEGLICTYKVSSELDYTWTLDADGNKKKVPIKNAKIDPISGLITFDNPQHVEERIFYPVVMGLEGGDAFYSGDELGHIIRVGMTHRLASWDQVNTNDRQSGVQGLHTGNIDYIRNFQSQGTQTHNVFVDPMNIGALTDDGSGALRVLEYFVHSSFAGVTRGIYHSSTYAKQTDAVYEGMFTEAVARFEEDRTEKEERLKEYAALRNI